MSQPLNFIRNMAIGLLASSVIAGCNDHPVDRLDKVVTAVNRQENSLPAKTKIDFIVVMDNSGSMCEEQDNLGANFSTFSTFLYDQLGDSADYRIAVVSTDMHSADKGKFLAKPANPVPSLNCTGADGNPEAPDTEDCFGEDNDLPLIIKSDNISSRDDLERKFRCLATLGTGGDGFEKGLEAMRLGLSCNGPNRDKFGQCCVEQSPNNWVYNPACEIPEGVEDPEFLRPDAVLVVLFLTDEDDCSDPASNPGASRRAICKYGAGDSDNNGIPEGYNDSQICGDRTPLECYKAECGSSGACQAGGTCSDGETCVQGQCVGNAAECRANRCEISRSENSNCEWFRGDLVPVNDYYRFLVSLKAQPKEDLVVAAIVGKRKFTPLGHELTYNPGRPANAVCDPDSDSFDPNADLDMCCPNGRCQGRLQPSCTSANGIAFAGRRYLALAEAFGDNGIGCPGNPEAEGYMETCVNICVDDFSTPLEAIRDKVIAIVGSYCLDKPPACQVQDGNQTRDCANEAERSDTANYQIRVRKQCLVLEDEGGRCAERLDPVYLSRNEWTLELNEDGCAGGALVRLAETPPAGADIVVEFFVAVTGAPPPVRDGGTPPDAAAAPDGSP